MKFHQQILLLLFFGIQSAEATPLYSRQTVKDSLEDEIVYLENASDTVTKIGQEDTDR